MVVAKEGRKKTERISQNYTTVERKLLHEQKTPEVFLMAAQPVHCCMWGGHRGKGQSKGKEILNLGY